MTSGDIHRIIGLTGTNASGKGEAARFFERAGYDHYSLSDLIREELMERDLALTRDNMIRTGNELRENFGPDVLARRIVERLRGKTVIDSIRNPKEIEYLKARHDFILLAIDAPAEIRYERSKKRGRDESAETLAEFIAKEQEEMTESEKSQQLKNCMDLADFTIVNDGSIEEFNKKLERFI